MKASRCALLVISVDSSTCKAKIEFLYLLRHTFSLISVDNAKMRLRTASFDKEILLISFSASSPNIVLTIYLHAGRMINSTKV